MTCIRSWGRNWNLLVDRVWKQRGVCEPRQALAARGHYPPMTIWMKTSRPISSNTGGPAVLGRNPCKEYCPITLVEISDRSYMHIPYIFILYCHFFSWNSFFPFVVGMEHCNHDSVNLLKQKILLSRSWRKEQKEGGKKHFPVDNRTRL